MQQQEVRVRGRNESSSAEELGCRRPRFSTRPAIRKHGRKMDFASLSPSSRPISRYQRGASSRSRNAFTPRGKSGIVMLAAVGTPRKRSRQGEAEGTKQPSSSRRGAKRSRQSNGHEVLDDDDDVANELLDLDHGDDDRDAEISQPALVRLDKAKLTIGLDRKRQEVLNRLSGHVTTTDDLVCLQEQAVTLEQTLKATVQRGESNSILLVGPRGSGKDAVSQASVSLRLNGGIYKDTMLRDPASRS